MRSHRANGLCFPYRRALGPARPTESNFYGMARVGPDRQSSQETPRCHNCGESFDGSCESAGSSRRGSCAKSRGRLSRGTRGVPRRGRYGESYNDLSQRPGLQGHRFRHAGRRDRNKTAINGTGIMTAYDVLDRGRLKFRRPDYLTCAEQLMRILQNVRKAVATANEQGRPTDGSDDGPVAPNGFRHNGKLYDAPPLAAGPFRALALMWKSEGRCASFSDLAKALYGDRGEALEEGTPRGLRDRLNSFFRAHDISFNAIKRQYSIAIKAGKPRPARSGKKSRPGRKKKTSR